MGQIVFSWDTFRNIPALEVWLKNLVCSFVFPILPLFYPNMVCEQLPNPIRIARKCLMCIKNLQYLSGFTYHLYLLTCFCYHSAMFAACEKSFVWGSVFTSFSIYFFDVLVVRQAFPEKQPVFLHNQIWGLGCFHGMFFFQGTVLGHQFNSVRFVFLCLCVRLFLNMFSRVFVIWCI
jgi:hypothetical protein